MGQPLRVLFVTSEAVPFAKTGGLADVAGALPKFLQGLGCELTLVMPYYRMVRKAGLPIQPVEQTLKVTLGDETLSADLYQSELMNGLPVYFIGREEFFDREYLYTHGCVRSQHIVNYREKMAPTSDITGNAYYWQFRV